MDKIQTKQSRAVDWGLVSIMSVTIAGVLMVLGSARVWNAESVEHMMTSLAILVGGGWALYQFALKKAFESSLTIDVYVESHRCDTDTYLVYIQARVTNIGHRRITLPPLLTPHQVHAHENSVQYPADLQLKKLDINAVDPGLLGWWSRVPEVLVSPEHTSLVYEYTRPDAKGQQVIDFFLEPQERYDLGIAYKLTTGHYLAKVVFIGTREAAFEFWSRIVYFNVPATSGWIASQHG